MKKFIIPVLAFAPVMLFAQTQQPTLGNLQTLVRSIGAVVKLALPVVVGIALLVFFWGLAKFIFSAGDEESRKDGKNFMVYSIIALFVMVAVWGLVNFIASALGITPTSNPTTVPTVPIP